MQEDVLKIALAAFMHDIGKFAERGNFDASRDYLERNAQLYQPYIASQNRFTHRHAVYSAAFIEKLQDMLPERLNARNWGIAESFVNLAAGHHRPETPLQWIIAVADRVSSGFDRKTFEEYNSAIEIKDYRRTRLYSLLEQIDTDKQQHGGSAQACRHRYPLRELSPSSIFPQPRDVAEPKDDMTAGKEYQDLLERFCEELSKLENRDTVSLWFEHFESLFLLYASHIPAATVGTVIPDVSLFDHSRMTAAMAAALYLYHKEKGTLEIKAVKEDYESKKFMLISGDFYGIQNFIFSHGGSTAKAAAKLLRGRSFAVSLLSELAADLLCREIGIPTISVILNAAGKFTIMAPCLEKVRKSLRNIEAHINAWLTEHFYGEVAMGLSSIEASCEDFLTDNFNILWGNLQSRSDEHKYHKLDLELAGGVVDGYLDRFVNTLKSPLCPFCGKRPSRKEVENDPLLKDIVSACAICRDHILMGDRLVKADKIAILNVDVTGSGMKLKEPIFGKYQISFDTERKQIDHFEKSGMLLKYWDIRIADQTTVHSTITAKFINGYVPVYGKDDEQDDRILHGSTRDEKKLELIDMMQDRAPKSFTHLAKMALIPEGKGFRGTEALGVLKADVDNLGLIFACGIRENTQSLSRFATMSRQMNSFFALYMPWLLKNEPAFRNIYTIFSGGDDLFLLGPWNSILQFSVLLQKKFREYTCTNPFITISAGIAIHKPGSPVAHIADHAEEALACSKSGGRDSITLFGHTARWEEFDRLGAIHDTIEKWHQEQMINNAMLYRLNLLSDMARKDKRLRARPTPLSMEEMAPFLLWRSMFRYSVTRNVGKTRKGADRERAVDEVLTAAQWLEEFDARLRMPLWQFLYNHR